MQEESEGNILADQVQKLTERAAAREQALVEMDALLCLQNAELEWIGKQFRAHRGPNGTTHFEAWVPGAHSCIVLAARRALAPASPSEREEQFRRELVDGIRSLHPAPLVQPEPQPEEQG
jgi:hypothetical protein